MNIAIITGASSGLGREYARLLAADTQIDELWLIARRAERLLALQEELLPRTCQVITCDLTRNEALAAIAKRLTETTGIHIQWLINAAGFGRIGSCQEIGTDDSARLIDLNCRAAVALTQLSLPYMHAGSHILEICSCAAFQPIPYLAVYAASKAFLLSYSRALGQELSQQQISVTAVCPYWIKDTEFIATARKTDRHHLFRQFPFACTQTKIARRSLKAARQGQKICTPDAISLLDRIISTLIPHCILLHASKLYRRSSQP